MLLSKAIKKSFINKTVNSIANIYKIKVFGLLSSSTFADTLLFISLIQLVTSKTSAEISYFKISFLKLNLEYGLLIKSKAFLGPRLF